MMSESMHREKLRQRILYPVTRVRAGVAGGSGVLVYSQPDVKNPTQHINLALTCEHVIDGAIQVKKDWDPVLKAERTVDFFEEVSVEVFDYDGSNVISANATQATIVAYDKRHDLALIRLRNPRKLLYVASIIPEDQIKDLGTFDPCWTSGCSLLHEPFANPGTLTYLREVIEQKTYLMANSPGVFGNSGGGLFHGESGLLLGLTSRVQSLQLGFSVDVMTWMNFSTHPERLYEFFKAWELQFIYDPSDDWYKAEERREAKRRAATRRLLFGDEKSPTKPAPVSEFEA